MKKILNALIVWVLKRQEKSLERKVSTLYDDMLYYARKADDTDQMRQPVIWGKYQNNVNWCRYMYRIRFEELQDIRKSLSKRGVK